MCQFDKFLSYIILLQETKFSIQQRFSVFSIRQGGFSGVIQGFHFQKREIFCFMRLIYDAFLNDKNMSTENINIFISLENNYPKSQRALQQTLQQLYNSVGLCICAHFPFFYFDQFFFFFQSFFIWPIMNLFQKCFHDLFNSYLGWIVSPYLRTKVQGFSGDTTIVIHEIYFIEQYIFLFVCFGLYHYYYVIS